MTWEQQYRIEARIELVATYLRWVVWLLCVIAGLLFGLGFLVAVL